MARAQGPVAGAADYLCRFCEVAVHVKPDGREAVSYRIAGERREFALLGNARLSFPLPGMQAPEDVIVPVSEAALVAAPGAGHPVTLPSHPVGLPAHPVPLPTAAPVGLPEHPVTLPDHPVGLPAHAVQMPEHPVRRPAHPVTRPAHAVPVPRAGPVGRPGHPVLLPGHPVGRPGHPVGIVAAAAPADDEPRTVEHVVVAAEPSRFCARSTPMPSVLR
jgi:hypothetical protein